MERTPRVLATLQSVSFLVALLALMVLIGGLLTSPVREGPFELDPGTKSPPIRLPVPGDLTIGPEASGGPFFLAAGRLAFLSGIAGDASSTAVLSDGDGERRGPVGRSDGGRGRDGRDGGRRGDRRGSSGPDRAPAKSEGGGKEGGKGSGEGGNDGGPGNGGPGNGGPGKGGGSGKGGGPGSAGEANVAAGNGGGGAGPAKGADGGSGPGNKGNKGGKRG